MHGPTTPPPPRDDDNQPPEPSGAARAARMARSGAQGVGRGTRFVVGKFRRFTHAEGAGESGLSRLMELHAFNAAGDITLAIALAGTLFFSVPTDEARGDVALFLLLTMLPFTIVAPLIGPFLDRFSRGRRWAIGATMALRAWMCWILAGAVVNDAQVTLFWAALVCLVASRAYGIARAAGVPRVLPEGLSLVKANSRISLSGSGGAVVAAPLAGLFALFGAEWTLRFAFVVFAGATVMAILLPASVDDNRGEEDPGIMAVRNSSQRGRRYGITPAVVNGLRGNVALRFIAGFLVMYMAFLLRGDIFEDSSLPEFVLLGIVIGAAGLGNTIGVFLGSYLKDRGPERLIAFVVLLDVAILVLAAVLFGLVTAVMVGFAAGMCQFLGKMGIDAIIQRDVVESVRTSMFARSETVQQLAWVIGGFGGLGFAFVAPHWSLGFCAAVTIGWFVWANVWSRGRQQRAAEREAAKRAANKNADRRRGQRPGSQFDRDLPPDLRD